MTTRDQALNRIRPDVRAMHAYAVQSAQGLLKLDAMENPFRLPPDLQRALGERLGALALNRYPGTRSDDLKAALAQVAGMPAGCAMALGNGSDELISLVTQAVAQPWDTAAQRPVVLAPVPGFVMYALSAQLLGLQFVGVPLTEDFELDLPAMLSAIEAHRPALTHIAYPNNPTATLWSEAAVQAVVDPKGDDYVRYAGATLLTPNRSELRQVVGGWRDDAELEQKASRLRSELKLDALLVTRSEEGMTLFSADATAHVPAVAREVYDVSGAGDTVIATLAVMLGSGLPLPESMRQANLAAGVVVGKLGAATCTLDELKQIN